MPHRYCLLLETNPFLTKAATSLVGFALGDVLAQRLEGSAVIDAGRVLHLGLYGFLLDGPVGHLWYKCAPLATARVSSALCAPTGFGPALPNRPTRPCRWLDGTCDKTFENPKGTASVAVKTTADQIIWAPIMTCVFFAFLKFMEGHPELMLPTIQEKVLPTVAANYVIWPAAHIVSFKYVPSHQRILYNNGIAIFWNCYLSLVASGGGMDVAALGGVDPSSASNLAGLHDIAMRVQSTLPYNGYWIQDLLDLQNPIGTSAAQLAAKGASSPFIDSVLNMQNMTLGR